MKLTRYFYIGAVAVAGLSSCVSENLDEARDASQSKGQMSLNVSLLEPQATRAVTEVSDFPVVVRDSEGNVVNSYNKVSDVPSIVVYNTGTYTVESHTPGELKEGTETQYPYYYGSETKKIETGLTTDFEVLCKRKNGSVEVKYDDDAFLELYKSWTITVTDLNGVAPVFPDENRANPNFVYWNFRENLSSLRVNFVGITKENVTIKDSQDITKANPQGTEMSYDDDSEFFHGCGFGADTDTVRVFCARRSFAAHKHDKAGKTALQSVSRY